MAPAKFESLKIKRTRALAILIQCKITDLGFFPLSEAVWRGI